MAKRFIFNATAASLVSALALVAASTALAAGGDHHYDAGTLLKDFLYRILNFGVLVAILAFFITRPLKKALAERRETLTRDMEAAKKARDEAEEKFAEYDRKLKDATAEIEHLQAEIRREGELERDKIIANAREMAAKIAKDAEGLAAQEVSRARQYLRQEAASLAISLAREMLQKNFTEADQKRLVDEYMQRMQKVGELR